MWRQLVGSVLEARAAKFAALREHDGVWEVRASDGRRASALRGGARLRLFRHPGVLAHWGELESPAGLSVVERCARPVWSEWQPDDVLAGLHQLCETVLFLHAAGQPLGDEAPGTVAILAVEGAGLKVGALGEPREGCVCAAQRGALTALGRAVEAALTNVRALPQCERADVERRYWDGWRIATAPKPQPTPTAENGAMGAALSAARRPVGARDALCTHCGLDGAWLRGLRDALGAAPVVAAMARLETADALTTQRLVARWGPIAWKTTLNRVAHLLSIKRSDRALLQAFLGLLRPLHGVRVSSDGVVYRGIVDGTQEVPGEEPASHYTPEYHAFLTEFIQSVIWPMWATPERALRCALLRAAGLLLPLFAEAFPEDASARLLEGCRDADTSVQMRSLEAAELALACRPGALIRHLNVLVFLLGDPKVGATALAAFTRVLPLYPAYEAPGELSTESKVPNSGAPAAPAPAPSNTAMSGPPTTGKRITETINAHAESLYSLVSTLQSRVGLAMTPGQANAAREHATEGALTRLAKGGTGDARAIARLARLLPPARACNLLLPALASRAGAGEPPALAILTDVLAYARERAQVPEGAVQVLRRATLAALGVTLERPPSVPALPLSDAQQGWRWLHTPWPTEAAEAVCTTLTDSRQASETRAQSDQNDEFDLWLT